MQTYQTSAAEILACDWFLKSADMSANNLNSHVTDSIATQ